MSYILDALKRADAERQRGAVPGLHAQQLATPRTAQASNGRRRLWLGFALALVPGVGATLWWRWQASVPVIAPIAIAPVAQAPRPAVTPVLSPAMAPAATSPPLAASAPVAKLAPVAAARAVVPPTPTQAKPSAKLASAAIQMPAVVPLLSELAQEIRSQVPALAITGAVYSGNPGQRLLLVNNQVLTQGSQVAAELTLLEIGEHSSVFEFRGNRFRLMH